MNAAVHEPTCVCASCIPTGSAVSRDQLRRLMIGTGNPIIKAPARRSSPKKKRDYEQELTDQMKLAGLEAGRDFREQYQFVKDRRWRFDWAFPSLPVYNHRSNRLVVGLHLAVELEGITSIKQTKTGKLTTGGHQSPKGFRSDIEKYARAQLEGWWLYRCLPSDVVNGKALDHILRVLGEPTGRK